MLFFLILLDVMILQLSLLDIQGQPLGSQFQDTSRRVEDAHHAGWRKYPYSHAIGSRRDMMSMSGRW